jgi:hypothetical protein
MSLPHYAGNDDKKGFMKLTPSVSHPSLSSNESFGKRITSLTSRGSTIKLSIALMNTIVLLPSVFSTTSPFRTTFELLGFSSNGVTTDKKSNTILIY